MPAVSQGPSQLHGFNGKVKVTGRWVRQGGVGTGAWQSSRKNTEWIVGNGMEAGTSPAQHPCRRGKGKKASQHCLPGNFPGSLKVRGPQMVTAWTRGVVSALHSLTQGCTVLLPFPLRRDQSNHKIHVLPGPSSHVACCRLQRGRGWPL